MIRPGVGVLLTAFVSLAGSSAFADERSTELLRRDCSTQLGRNELTLFANGTIRLREWRGSDKTLRLAELGRDELDAFLRRIGDSDPGEREAIPSGVTGDWVESCVIELRVSGTSERTFRYGRLDTHELTFAAFLRIVDELAAIAAERAAESPLPAGYDPRRGDVLVRIDGVEFEVVGFTVDGNGVELRGRIDPLTIYIPRSELRQLFNRLAKVGP